MLASEVIEKLEILIEEHDDKQVCDVLRCVVSDIVYNFPNEQEGKFICLMEE